MADGPGLLARWTRPESRSRRVLLAAFVYVVCTGVYAAVAGPDRLVRHTQYNHYALLADAWIHGRQFLAGGPPSYAMNNDFVDFQGKTYISFPPLPAMLMLPFVKLSGSAENFRDGQFILWLAGLAPAILFLVLEKLRRTGRAPRTARIWFWLSSSRSAASTSSPPWRGPCGSPPWSSRRRPRRSTCSSRSTRRDPCWQAP
jgi:hypothetical protein